MSIGGSVIEDLPSARGGAVGADSRPPAFLEYDGTMPASVDRPHNPVASPPTGGGAT